jgi:hypothetical protein
MPPLKKGEGKKGTVSVVVGMCASPEMERAIVVEGVRASIENGRATRSELLWARVPPLKRGGQSLGEGSHASPEKGDGKKEDQRRHPVNPLKRGGGRSSVRSLPSYCKSANEQ